MNAIIKWPRIAQVKDTWFLPALHNVRHTSGKANVGLPAEIRRRAVFRNIGKVALDPDNELVTDVTVVGKRIVGGESY